MTQTGFSSSFLTHIHPFEHNGLQEFGSTAHFPSLPQIWPAKQSVFFMHSTHFPEDCEQIFPPRHSLSKAHATQAPSRQTRPDPAQFSLHVPSGNGSSDSSPPSLPVPSSISPPLASFSYPIIDNDMSESLFRTLFSMFLRYERLPITSVAAINIYSMAAAPRSDFLNKFLKNLIKPFTILRIHYFFAKL